MGFLLFECPLKLCKFIITEFTNNPIAKFTSPGLSDTIFSLHAEFFKEIMKLHVN